MIYPEVTSILMHIYGQKTTVVNEQEPLPLKGQKLEPLYNVNGENAKWCSHYGKQYGGSSKTLKIELSYDQQSYF